VARGLSSAGAIKVPQGQLRNRLHGVVQDLSKPFFGEKRHLDQDSLEIKMKKKTQTPKEERNEALKGTNALERRSRPEPPIQTYSAMLLVPC
jgi:hypothetical protein